MIVPVFLHGSFPDRVQVYPILADQRLDHTHQYRVVGRESLYRALLDDLEYDRN